MVPRLLIVAQDSQAWAESCKTLNREGFDCSVTAYHAETINEVARHSPDIVIIEIDSKRDDTYLWGLVQSLKQEKQLPVIPLVSTETLDSVKDHPELDEFLTIPFDISELVLRINRLINRKSSADASELIKFNDLSIDLANCEVTLQGKPVELTFKEYELLKFLASHQGRVHNRQTLLNKVWGYDYYGGDRTVDVHVRRLRSKIEDSTHTFIETVRNIGYRFTNGSIQNADV